ncbi:MAG: DUF5107 domain-containing protein [Bacteroidales bacterium]|nr:DUF5107 domain-containing protein [Bacteroidales bacterium]
MKRILLILMVLLPLCPVSGRAQGVKAYEGKITLPTYLLDPAEQAPIFERDWSYQRAKRSVYPYPLNDNMTRNRQDVTYDCLYLENEYVELCIIPEIGGRLMYAIDKTNGYDIFYHNHVVKPANVGMTGAWISGGVEWNVFHHHRQTSHIPCDWQIVANQDGSKTIWLGETEYRHRMQWAIGVTLHPGKSYMEISGRLMNGTPDSNSILYWSNVSTLVDENYEICLPQSTEFVTFHCKNWFAHWPVTHETFNGMDFYKDGVDASWWKNHYMSNSMFVYDQKADFVGGYDHGRHAGTMLTGNHNIIKGGKFWLWGPNSEWDTKILTDNSGHYIELMVGAYSDNQPDYNWNFPYETKEFSQYWYGIRDIEGVKAGDRHAAINMDLRENGSVLLGVNATEKMSGLHVSLMRAGQPVFEDVIASIDPAHPYVKTISVDPSVTEHELTMVLSDRDGNQMLSYNPVVKDPNAPLPPIVERPKKPADITNTEECYLVGLRNLQFHNPFINPADYFLEVLRRDPGDTRANTQMGVWYRKRGEYDMAAGYLRTAIRRQTKDYTRPVDAEAMYNLGLVLKAQGKYDAAMDTLYRATWNYTFNSAANTQLAQMYAQKGDWEMALDRLQEAVAYNGRNFQALDFMGLVLNKLGRTKEAQECFKSVLEADPVNAMALCETASISGFHKFMREQPESYLELAILYWHNGFKDRALTLLNDINVRVAYPTVKLYLAYLTGEDSLYREALELPVGYCAPFRLETIEVLQKASQVCPDSERPHYYLGNLLYNIQPDNAISEWRKCVEMNPRDDLAWRNLGWANWLYTKDYAEASRCYRKAIELNPAPLYLEECDQAMEALKAPVSERYELLKSHHDTGVKRYYPLAQEVILGTYEGDYDYVLDLLDNCYFPTREGVANFHDNFVDACILAGQKKFRSRDYEGAIALYNKAFEYPENHQVFLVNERATHDAQINYELGLAYEKLGNADKAREHFQLAADQDFNLKGSKDFRYWTGLALLKLGRKGEAKEIFRNMVSEGQSRIITEYINFYGAEGTTGATVEGKNSAAYYTQALGELGLGHKLKARKLLRKVQSLKPDHLWANELLKAE